MAKLACRPSKSCLECHVIIGCILLLDNYWVERETKLWKPLKRFESKLFHLDNICHAAGAFAITFYHDDKIFMMFNSVVSYCDLRVYELVLKQRVNFLFLRTDTTSSSTPTNLGWNTTTKKTRSIVWLICMFNLYG